MWQRADTMYTETLGYLLCARSVDWCPWTSHHLTQFVELYVDQTGEIDTFSRLPLRNPMCACCPALSDCWKSRSRRIDAACSSDGRGSLGMNGAGGRCCGIYSLFGGSGKYAAGGERCVCSVFGGDEDDPIFAFGSPASWCVEGAVLASSLLQPPSREHTLFPPRSS